MDIALRYARSKGDKYHEYFIEAQLNVLDRILEGEPYYASTFYIPGEWTPLLDRPVLYMERISGFAAANRLVRHLSDKRVQASTPGCDCTYQLMFQCLLDEGLIPPPSGYLAMSYACNNAFSFSKASAARYDVPCYSINVPRIPNMHTISDLGRSLARMGASLNVCLDSDRLTNAIKLSNSALAIKNQIDQLRILYPGILDATDGFKLFTIYNDLGSNHAVAVLEQLLATIEKRISGYRPPLGSKWIWLGVIPLYRNNLLMETECRLGGRFVYEELFSFGDLEPIQADSFYKDLARRIVNSHFFSVQRRADFIMDIAAKMGVEGIVCFSQRNCSFLPPTVPYLRRTLKSTGMAFMDFTGDVIDPNYFDEGKYWLTMEEWTGMQNGGACRVR
ncbi:2-hydroxyacyl-CoA dehydratase family protein [Paenibacillus sp. M1]|uniref:2-hydroxyacyl-CoA dehydratase family protein n=1 Tax=Paenibacillus haidiansis TaxID=1574488 RepID=A0ABU7VQ71_9BACL